MGMTQPVTSPVTNGGIIGETLNSRAAAQIRALMAARRKTSMELGEILQLSQSAASRRMHGDGTFTVNQIQAVADWLGVPITDILAPTPGGNTYNYCPAKP